MKAPWPLRAAPIAGWKLDWISDVGIPERYDPYVAFGTGCSGDERRAAPGNLWPRPPRADLRRRGVDAVGGTFGLCGGAEFSARAGARRQRLRPGKARLAGRGSQRASRGRSAFRQRRGCFGAVVGCVQIPAAQRSDQAVRRPQSESAGGRGRDQERPIQRAGPAWIVLSADSPAIRRHRMPCSRIPASCRLFRQWDRSPNLPSLPIS